MAAPTTAGTGTDVSQFAVITDTTHIVKATLIGKALVPDISVTDPCLLVIMPDWCVGERRDGDPASGALSTTDRELPTANRPAVFADLLGVRSSKGRYHKENRRSTHDLERTLTAVNAVSWVLADAEGDARYLVDNALPVIARLLGARAVVLITEHPALGGKRVCIRSLHPHEVGSLDEQQTEELMRHAEVLAEASPPAGVMCGVPELACTLLLAPLPRGGRGDGYVVAALSTADRAGATDLAILGTLTNQLAGAIESCRRLAESEVSRRAADDALRDADERVVALGRRNELLKQAHQNLVAAREQQVLAKERQRIARDLHDSVAQHVLSMGMQVEWCRTSSDQPEVVERLAEVKELARSTVDRIRQAIFELNGGDELNPGGLVPALRRLAEQHRGQGLAVGVRVAGKRPGLPGSAERVLYMVAKEALFNTVIHAEATRASVHLVLASDEVRLRVADDGWGKAEDLRRCLLEAQRSCADGYHRGLANLDERVRQVGGRLTITDAPRRGVRLQVAIPVGLRRRHMSTPKPVKAAVLTDTGEPVRLVIVDDHAIIRQGLRTMLERDGDMLVVGEAGAPQEARAAVREQRPDVVLLDLKLGEDEDAGLSVCRQLKADDPGVRCLVLTTFLNERLVVEAIRSGAKGYVLKDVDAQGLVRSILAVHAGESAFDSHAAAVVVKSMSGEQASDSAVSFTARESEVVRLLANGLSNRQIGQALFISETTVKFHVHNVMGKLGVKRRAEVVYRSGQLGLLPM